MLSAFLIQSARVAGLAFGAPPRNRIGAETEAPLTAVAAATTATITVCTSSPCCHQLECVAVFSSRTRCTGIREDPFHRDPRPPQEAGQGTQVCLRTGQAGPPRIGKGVHRALPSVTPRAPCWGRDREGIVPIPSSMPWPKAKFVAVKEIFFFPMFRGRGRLWAAEFCAEGKAP